MKFIIKHEIPGRLRVHFDQPRMTCREADTLLYYLHCLKHVTGVKVYERTADASVCYVGDRDEVIAALRRFRYESVNVPSGVIEHSGRELNASYQEKLVKRVVMRTVGKYLLPAPLGSVLIGIRSAKYIWRGLKTF